MKCYIHPERDAIGVCVMCGHGVCDACSVNLGGKIYCKQCVEKVVTRPNVEASSRAASITVASILLYIFGAWGIISSLFLIIFGGIFGGIGDILYPYYTQNVDINIIKGIIALIAGISISLGIIYLISSILEIVAGYWLWRSLKNGGILGIIVSVLNILIGILLLFILSIVIHILIIVLIAIGWNTLK